MSSSQSIAVVVLVIEIAVAVFIVGVGDAVAGMSVVTIPCWHTFSSSAPRCKMQVGVAWQYQRTML